MLVNIPHMDPVGSTSHLYFSILHGLSWITLDSILHTTCHSLQELNVARDPVDALNPRVLISAFFICTYLMTFIHPKWYRIDP